MNKDNNVLTKKLSLEEKRVILSEPLLREALGNDAETSADVLAIIAGGSDRKFYRIVDNNHDKKLIFLSDHDKDNFISFIEIATFFYQHSIPVPLIYEYDLDSRQALLEDLGDESLFRRVRLSNDHHVVREHYQKIIDVLVTLQGIMPADVAACPPIQNRIMDYSHLRWETSYFTQYFLREYCGLPIQETEGLEDGFHQLAASFADEKLVPIHRDFQSQNIIMAAGQPHLIDFQGARKGPYPYDLASLLNDCYIVLPDELRNLLISYYLKQSRERSGVYYQQDDFKYFYLRSALQRNMQALGAFGFLTLIKKKKQFEAFIPAGVRYIKTNLPDYPPLAKLNKIISKMN